MDNFDQDLTNRLLTAEDLLFAAQRRIQALDHRIKALEERPRRDDDLYDFRTTLIVVLSPRVPTDAIGWLDQTIAVDSYAEAEAAQAEIMAKRSSQKRKVLIAVERSLTSVPFQ